MVEKRPNPNGSISSDFPTSEDEMGHMDDFPDTIMTVGRTYSGRMNTKDPEIKADGGTATQNTAETNIGDTQANTVTRPKYTWRNLEKDLINVYSDPEMRDHFEDRFNVADVVNALSQITRTKQEPHPRFPVDHSQKSYKSIDRMLKTINMKSNTLNGIFAETYSASDSDHPFTEYAEGRGSLVHNYEIDERELTRNGPMGI